VAFLNVDEGRAQAPASRATAKFPRKDINSQRPG
jgi:hypothetical protein